MKPDPRDCRPGLAIPLKDLYGNIVGELVIDQYGELSGSINPDSFWNSISRVGHLGIVDSVSIVANIGPPARPASG